MTPIATLIRPLEAPVLARYHEAPPCAAVYRCVSPAVKYQNGVGRYRYGGGVSLMNLQSVRLLLCSLSMFSIYAGPTIVTYKTTQAFHLASLKIGGGKKLEAFSIQLVNLALWKQALHVFHTHAAYAIEGIPSKETTKLKDISKMRHSPDTQECLDVSNSNRPDDICSQM